MSELTYQESIVIEAPVQKVYEMVADVTRTGEWSPICTSCWWDDPAQAVTVGAWFTGRNELPKRTWETRSEVVVADPGREFAFVVGGNLVRWGYLMAEVERGTELTETWAFLPGGIAYFHEKYEESAEDEIVARTEAAHTGIPATLAAIKRIAETAA